MYSQIKEIGFTMYNQVNKVIVNKVEAIKLSIKSCKQSIAAKATDSVLYYAVKAFILTILLPIMVVVEILNIILAVVLAVAIIIIIIVVNLIKAFIILVLLIAVLISKGVRYVTHH